MYDIEQRKKSTKRKANEEENDDNNKNEDNDDINISTGNSSPKSKQNDSKDDLNLNITDITFHHQKPKDIMLKFATRSVKWSSTIDEIKRQFFLGDGYTLELKSNPEYGILNPIDCTDKESQTLASVYFEHLGYTLKKTLTTLEKYDIWANIKKRSLVL